MTVLLDKLRSRFKDKKILIVGLGLQGGGVGLAKFFCELGAKVKVTDLKREEELLQSINKLKSISVEFILGKHRLKDFLKADYIFKGPSMPWDYPYIIEAQKKGVPVEMEASFFASLCPAPIIGVTGTRGKSTTTMMIFRALRELKSRVFLGGNFPNLSTIDLLKKVKKDDIIVLELSSWALSGFHRKKLSPHIAVFTNLYTDHLNYYSSVKDYLYDKKAIYLYQKPEDFLIANKRLENEIKHDDPKAKVIFFQEEDFLSPLAQIKGKHNLENAAAALAVAKVLNLNLQKSAEIIRNFEGLPYRQEVIRTIDNIIFINDTTSTTPVAATKAIESFPDSSIVLIIGGNSKNLPYNDLIGALKNVHSIILLKGTFTDEILPQLKKLFPTKISQVFENLEDAVEEVYERAKKINTKTYVLFSPAATSFASFKNEFHRGDAFNSVVKKIAKNK